MISLHMIIKVTYATAVGIIVMNEYQYIKHGERIFELEDGAQLSFSSRTNPSVMELLKWG